MLPGALAALRQARWEHSAYLVLLYLARPAPRARVAWAFPFDLFAAFLVAPPGASSFILYHVVRLHRHTRYYFIWTYKTIVSPGGFQDSKQRALFLVQEHTAGREYNVC